MPAVNGRINTPIVPGSGTGPGGIGPARQPAVPGGPGLPSSTGLSARTSGGPTQLRNATLPPFGKSTGPSPMGPRTMPASMSQTAAPKQPPPTLGGGTSGLAFGQRPAAKPAGPRPMPTSPQTPQTAPQKPPQTPPHTSSLPHQKPLSQPIETPPPANTSAPSQPAMVQTGGIPMMPMESLAVPMVQQAMASAIQQGVDPQVALQACMAAMGIEGGASGMPGVAMAQGEAGVGQAQVSMDAAMNQMSQVMMMQMKHQTQTAIMKMIVDMNMALAKEIKKTGQSVKELAG